MTKILKPKHRNSPSLDKLFLSPERGRQLLLRGFKKAGQREWVAANLFDLRRKAALSQRELAEKAGLGFRTLQRVELDPGYSPSLDILIRLSSSLHVPTERLLRKADFKKIYRL